MIGLSEFVPIQWRHPRTTNGDRQHRSLHLRRFLHPNSVALTFSPQKLFHALCFRGRESAVLWQRMTADAA